MRDIAWLQVSDIHMRVREEWSQDVVLSSLAASIEKRTREGLSVDFILVTGDLAYSGKPEEYKLVERFFDKLFHACRIPKERIYCVPGNHDVNRDRQTMCFRGARSALTSPNAVDPVLQPEDNLGTLLERQQAYQEFQASYFKGQDREATKDGLGYAASLTIDGVVLAILGLNSAWLAEGGSADHGNLLIGERQVLNGVQAVRAMSPHVVIGMAHHPLRLLREFDRIAVERHLTQHCDFFHCGHLHQPEASGAGFNASACLTVSAGASYETREAHNAYSIVRLSLAQGTRTLTTVQYDVGSGGFTMSRDEQFPIQISSSQNCAVDELAVAIAIFNPPLKAICNYLAALLLDRKSEVPISGPNGYAFGNVAVMEALPRDELFAKTTAFLRFKNYLAVFVGRLSLQVLLADHGGPISAYGHELISRGKADTGLGERLAAQDADVRSFAPASSASSVVVDLFEELLRAEEWGLLHEQASRHLGSMEKSTAIQAQRMVAVAQAHSSERAQRAAAVAIYEALLRDGFADGVDRSNLAILLVGLDRVDDAKSVILQGISEKGIQPLERLLQVGQQLVGDTGDREFRKLLEKAQAERESHG